MSRILRLGIDDDYDVEFIRNNDGLEEQLSTTFSSLQKKEIELIMIRAVEQTMEPLLRRIVKEEIGFIIKGTFDTPIRILQLGFQNKLPKQVLTGSKIEGENGSSIQVALIDQSTGETVKSGPVSSAQIQILVLESYHLGEENLNQKINAELNESKKSLLHGNEFIRLKEGIGCINDLSFAHRSKWLKQREFTLVATVLGNWNGIIVKAAVMEPFTLKDRRNNLYVKHGIPTPSDDIWRLTNINRGAPIQRSLAKNDINTVEAFLREFNLNPERLREVVGKEMSEKAFEETVAHAKKCSFNRETTYWCQGVVFNVVGEIMGLDFDGREFITFDQLLDEEIKVLARKSVLYAFDSKEKLLVPYNKRSLFPHHEILSSSHSLIPTPTDHEYNYEAGSSSQRSIISHDLHHPLFNGEFHISMGMSDFYEQEEEMNLSAFSVDDGNSLLRTGMSIMNINAQKRWKLLCGVLRLIFKRRIAVSESCLYEPHKRQKMMIIC